MSCTHRNASRASSPTYSRRAIALLKSSNSELNQVTWLESIQSDEIDSRSNLQPIVPSGLGACVATSTASSSTRTAPRSPWTVYSTLRTPAFHDRCAEATPVGNFKLHVKSSSVSKGPSVAERAVTAVGYALSHSKAR